MSVLDEVREKVNPDEKSLAEIAIKEGWSPGKFLYCAYMKRFLELSRYRRGGLTVWVLNTMYKRRSAVKDHKKWEEVAGQMLDYARLLVDNVKNGK